MFHRPAAGELRSSRRPKRRYWTFALGLGAVIFVSSAGARLIQATSHAQEIGAPAAASAEQRSASDEALTAVWANTGEDKVTQEEIRSKSANPTLLNSAWDGRNVRLAGARNEIVAFNLILEAGSSRPAAAVSVEFNRLTGPDDFSLSSEPVPNSAGVFDWTRRDIELFHVRYLRIRGLSALSYGTYDERHIPSRFRRPKAADDTFTGGWADRPDHDKHYPDIAMPMELVPTFSIAAGQNQSVWADIYIPKNAPAGLFKGEVIIRVAGVVTYRVPVELTVRNFSLPDMPSAKTMVATSYYDVAQRYTGVAYPNPNSPQDKLTKLVMDRQMLLAHRHKISLIDDNSGAGPGTAISRGRNGSRASRENCSLPPMATEGQAPAWAIMFSPSPPMASGRTGGEHQAARSCGSAPTAGKAGLRQTIRRPSAFYI